MREKEHGAKKLFAPGRRSVTWLSMFLGGALLSVPLLALPLIGLVAIVVCVNAYLVWGLSSHTITVDQPISPPAEVAIQEPMAIQEPIATLAALTTRVAALSQGSASLPTPTSKFSLPSVTKTPPVPILVSHPMADYTIEGLRARTYPGGTIQVRSVLTTTYDFTRYYIDYPSDGLTITGIMQVPHGEGPFPVVILNHGYVPRDSYWSGADTWNAAQYLNRRGYLTIAPDFRSWGESDVANSFFSTGQVIDALNLISSLSSVPGADVERVGMWGHSMGGGVTTKAIAIDPRIKAAILYAPVSADDAEVLARWGTGCKGGEPDEFTEDCAGAEVLTSDIDEHLHLSYRSALSDPQILHQVSPINYFDAVVGPVQIHIGTEDTTTPPEWSDSIGRALQGADKEVEYFPYPGQGHTFEGEHWRLFMERVTQFFDRHLANTS
jgi:dienelactone hydrolase